MQAHLVGRNISRLRVSPLVSFPILLPHFLSKREMTLRGDSQFNKQNAERERWQISRPRCIFIELTLESVSALPLSPQALVPEFDFDTYLGALMPRKLNDTESVVIYALPYYQKLTNLLRGTKKRFVGVLRWDMQMGNQILQT